MPRVFAFFAALVLSTLLVASAGTASASDTVRFTLEPARKDGEIRASFRKADRDNHNWSTSFPAGELVGLDISRLRASQNAPLSFAIVREAGRLDCAGNGANSMAVGSCALRCRRGFPQFSHQPRDSPADPRTRRSD